LTPATARALLEQLAGAVRALTGDDPYATIRLGVSSAAVDAIEALGGNVDHTVYGSDGGPPYVIELGTVSVAGVEIKAQRPRRDATAAELATVIGRKARSATAAGA
jgi:hypothetical protein